MGKRQRGQDATATQAAQRTQQRRIDHAPPPPGGTGRRATRPGQDVPAAVPHDRPSKRLKTWWTRWLDPAVLAAPTDRPLPADLEPYTTGPDPVPGGTVVDIGEERAAGVGDDRRTRVRMQVNRSRGGSALEPVVDGGNRPD